MQSTVSDREALIATLRDKYKNEWGDESLKQAADMLEADAQQLTSPQNPVAIITECPVNGQQTVTEIDGRWKFLRYGDLLFTGPVQKVTVPHGWQLVPIEPTREMVQACDAKFIPRVALPFFVAAYKTMLGVAPQPAAYRPQPDDELDAYRNADNGLYGPDYQGQ